MAADRDAARSGRSSTAVPMRAPPRRTGCWRRASTWGRSCWRSRGGNVPGQRPPQMSRVASRCAVRTSGRAMPRPMPGQVPIRYRMAVSGDADREHLRRARCHGVVRPSGRRVPHGQGDAVRRRGRRSRGTHRRAAPDARRAGVAPPPLAVADGSTAGGRRGAGAGRTCEPAPEGRVVPSRGEAGTPGAAEPPAWCLRLAGRGAMEPMSAGTAAAAESPVAAPRSLGLSVSASAAAARPLISAAIEGRTRRPQRRAGAGQWRNGDAEERKVAGEPAASWSSARTAWRSAAPLARAVTTSRARSR